MKIKCKICGTIYSNTEASCPNCPKRSFGELAMDIAKDLTEQDIENMLQHQAKEKKRKLLGQILIERNILTQEQVNEILSIQGVDILVCENCKSFYNCIIPNREENGAYQCINCHGELTVFADAIPGEDYQYNGHLSQAALQKQQTPDRVKTEIISEGNYPNRLLQKNLSKKAPNLPVEEGGSTTQVRLKAWIENLKKVDVVKEARETAEKKHLVGQTEQVRMRQEEEEKRRYEEQEEKRNKLKEYLASLKEQRQRMEQYRALTSLEKRIYQALAKWHNAQPLPVADGVLELQFENYTCTQTRFEPIIGEIDSTMKIKKMKASDKLKEMLLVFKRGKNIFLDLYRRDIKQNIFTFMFMNGRIQSHQQCSEVANVIGYFRQYHKRDAEIED